jgi:putative hydrolase of the HAD superfamily
MMFDVIAFDADDTLWVNEPLYLHAKEKFVNILLRYHSAQWIGQRLDKTELQNLERYGYGIKSFALSMIETAIELTEGRISGSEIQQIIELSWEMLKFPMHLLEGVETTIATLAASHNLMLITKGDLFEQEAKIARSGLSRYFHQIEIVSEKTPAAYQRIVRLHGMEPHRFVMIGNSLKSDVLPVIEIGGHAIHIPYETTWVHEMVPESSLEAKAFHRLSNISEVPQFIDAMKKQ